MYSLSINWIWLLIYNINTKQLFLLGNYSLISSNLNNLFGLDNFSVIFVILLLWLIPITYTLEWLKPCKSFSSYIILLLFIILLLTFYTLNLFIFYLFFEIITLLMFYIIIFFGISRYRLRAGYLFILYSLLSSVLILFTFFLIYLNKIDFIFNYIQLLYVICLSIAFIIKLPLVPFHNWLLEAHAESSTIGSIILASGILKLAIYGIYRFLLIYINNYIFIKFYLVILALISLFYISINIQRIVNLKQIIAASSIIHLSMGLIGILYINNTYLYISSILILIHHSLLSCLLFFICGEIKYLTNSLDITVIKSLSQWNSKFITFLFYALLINISFPISFAFIIELIYFSGLYIQNILLLSLIIVIIFFNTIYSFWLFNYLAYSDPFIFISKYKNIILAKNSSYINIIPLYILTIILILIIIYFSILIIYLI